MINAGEYMLTGKETKTEAIAGAFLGIKLEKGIHNIEIRARV